MLPFRNHILANLANLSMCLLKSPDTSAVCTWGNSIWNHTIYTMMQKKNRETNLWHNGCSWCSSSSSSRGDGQCIHISKSGGGYQWGAPQVTVCPSREHRLWGGMVDMWIQWQVQIDWRYYEVICAMGWMVKRERTPGGVMADGRCWCGKCASGHSEEKKRSIRVGMVVGEMTATKQHTAQEGEEHKNTSLKKST